MSDNNNENDNHFDENQDDNKKPLQSRFQDIVFPFIKGNAIETFFTFIASLILSFVPIIGNMLSFSIRMSYAVKLFRIKANIIKPDEESCFDSTLDIFKFQLWIYVPIIILALIITGKKIISFIGPLLLALLFKQLPFSFEDILKFTLILYLVLDVVFIILGFGFFVNYSLNKKIKLKIAVNIVKEHFCKIFFFFLPFITWSGLMIVLLSYTNINKLYDFLGNNIHSIMLFFMVKYYLFLIAITSLEKAISFQKENLEKYDKQIITKKDVCIFILLFVFLSGFLVFKKHHNSNKFIKYGEWIVVDDVMSKIRQPATANLLLDGNVLIMGGEDNSNDTADIFDPNQMKIIKTIPLDDKRYFGYTATTLKNGNIFIAGGETCPPFEYCKPIKSTKIFDSNNYTFHNKKSMKYNLSPFSKSILLSNGNVLILHRLCNHIGKDSKIKQENDKNYLYQVYNPYNNEYYFTKNIPYTTWGDSRYLILDNGNILVFLGASYIYDVKNNEFTRTKPQMPIGELFIPLKNNSYLNLNTTNEYTYGYIYYIDENKEIPVKNHIKRTWRAGNYPYAVPLANGNILIMGINVVKMKKEINAIKKTSTFLYDIKENMFFQIPNPPFPMSKPGIVTLPNGDILFAGGRSDKNGNKIQIYRYKH